MSHTAGPWLCSHDGHSTGDCGPMCECTSRIANGTYGAVAGSAIRPGLRKSPPERDIRGMSDEQYWDAMADARSY